jgi:hypothetical protein
MPRPTAARILYMIVGLILGLIGMLALQNYLLPSLVAQLPFVSTRPTAAAPSGPVAFSGQTLDRVQGLNLAQDKGGVAMRLNSIELYGDGFTLTYTLTSARNGASPQTLEPETFQVTDDRNTPYTISPLGTAAATSAGLTNGMVSFTPAPPADVRAIRVTIPNALVVGLRPREGTSRVVPGAWEFQVPLRS